MVICVCFSSQSQIKFINMCCVIGYYFQLLLNVAYPIVIGQCHLRQLEFAPTDLGLCEQLLLVFQLILDYLLPKFEGFVTKKKWLIFSLHFY